MRDRGLGVVAVALSVATSCSSAPVPPAPESTEGSRPDAAAGPLRSVREFMTGDECLFCHREAIGAGWQRNAHNRTVERLELLEAAAGAPAGAEFALGARDVRYWLKSTAEYGVLALELPSGEWDKSVFGTSCAGCHSSGVDPETGAFAAVSLDCFVCHGDVTLEHANDPARVHLSPRRADDPRVASAICGQCHLRGGRSRRTGRPWPSGFVAGDAQLDNFEFDFSEGALARLSLADRHVAENFRDVVVEGRSGVTCLSCHSIHGASSRSHRDAGEIALCFRCHVHGEPRSRRHPMTRSSSVCDVDRGT